MDSHNLFDAYEPALDYRSYFRYSRVPSDNAEDDTLKAVVPQSGIKQLISFFIVAFGYLLVLCTFPVTGWFAVKVCVIRSVRNLHLPSNQTGFRLEASEIVAAMSSLSFGRTTSTQRTRSDFCVALHRFSGLHRFGARTIFGCAERVVSNGRRIFNRDPALSRFRVRFERNQIVHQTQRLAFEREGVYSIDV